MKLSEIKREVLSAELLLIQLKIDAINGVIRGRSSSDRLVEERAVLLGQQDRLSILLKEST